MEALIQVMESAMGTRDPYTVGHQQRVTRLACALGRDFGLSPERLQALHTAAALHDLGKIAIPSGILSKPTKLTEIEFAMIKAHPRIGYDILKPLKFPEPIGKIILQHHERLNGSGYPQGLKGKKILMEARILSVADVVEAMCSHRPYRPALGLARAQEEISRRKGVLYDAGVVEACLKLCDQEGSAEQLFTVSPTIPLPQMVCDPKPVPRDAGGNLPQEQQRREVTGFLNLQALQGQQFRFLLQTAAASVLGCMIILSQGGL